MAESSKAFSNETLSVLRNKIDSFTKKYNFNKIGRIQHIFQFGSGYNQISLKLNNNNKLVFINTGDLSDSNEIIVNDVSFKKEPITSINWDDY